MQSDKEERNRKDKINRKIIDNPIQILIKIKLW